MTLFGLQTHQLWKKTIHLCFLCITKTHTNTGVSKTL